ncbi:uncharacterized protein LOC131302258 isoform X1 [Rhododendron vialii]|uniref:uncharacterized protein LOC131302258 isoform X1 n=2 Tax=Rhododendron vialii TaxID=182163 RepID=UPI0026604BD5|nr:uncharacterized protein LOC131302258 isoform X1 [Rhododendron vialii]
MASNIVVSSPAASSVSPNLPPEKEEEKERSVCIIAVGDPSGVSKYNWYAFDVSDDPNHNQPRPSVLDLTLPPALSPYYRKIPSYLLPFHEDDDYVSVNLEPIATSDLDSWARKFRGVTGWAVLGPTTTTTKQPATLYRLCADGNLTSIEDPGTSVQRIKLTNGGGGVTGRSGEWESVAKTPSPVTNPSCLVLRGKLYCLGGFTFSSEDPEGRMAPWPWAMAYDPGVGKWEPLPDPPCRPKDRDCPTFTAALDGGQWGPGIVVAWNGLLQIYHVNARSWGIQPFDCDHVFSRPRNAARPKNKGRRAVAVENMLYWYVVKEQCLVGYDLVTENWFRGHLPMHNHHDYILWDNHSPPSLVHLGRDGVDYEFCLSWVSRLPPRPKMEKEACISRLHCLKVCVFITNKIIRKTGIYHLEVSIITCQSYLVDGMKTFRGAMLVDGNLGYKTSPQFMMNDLDGELEKRTVTYSS